MGESDKAGKGSGSSASRATAEPPESKEPEIVEPSGSDPTPPEAVADDDEDRFTREELFANAHALTGYSRIVLAGALHGESNKTFTVEQAQDAAKTFLKREVS